LGCDRELVTKWAIAPQQHARPDAQRTGPEEIRGDEILKAKGSLARRLGDFVAKQESREYCPTEL
jgi:hypothetical protein